ncbi:putative miz zinc finger protein [Diaporthe ampelina]|uniref:Putative miz zinc finger protein n=1 Tax=Diaporthe ampelina TaxID=1214573 RepID=A0A0G2HV64_9PEZI|nr:putative miz zinc finger protein [Diaporthe ampelina]
MDSNTSLPPPDQYRSLVKRLQSSNYLLNKQLQHICLVNGLRTSGVKAELQRRILDGKLAPPFTLSQRPLEKAYAQGDPRAYRDIEQSILREKTGGLPAPHEALPSPLPVSNNAQSLSPNMNYGAYQTGYPGYGGVNGQRSHQMPPQDLRRNCANIQIKAQDNPLLARCVTEKDMRVLVFCAGGNTGPQDIAFPHQSELKVNGGDVKANLRGLKNKPGSTRPVDITDLLRLKIPNYANNIEFTYALTQKAGDKASQSNSQRFYLVVNVCKTTPVDTLVRTISGRRISKASVLHELTREAHDTEIEMSSQVLSLKCPLSYMRLVTPCRATTCTHVQCFDATSYLQLQQQGPQWLCPVCSKSAPYERLAIDEYVRDILDRTSRSVEQVDIEPNGRWKAHGSVEEVAEPEPEHEALAIDDDDLVISEISYVGNRGTNTPNTLAPTTSTPTPVTAASREGSSMPRSGGNKRAHAEVIDLTLSEDEEPPEPPRKKVQYGAGSAYSSYIG